MQKNKITGDQSHKRKKKKPLRPSHNSPWFPAMSKIDELLATVDTLTAQSDMIVSSVAESNMLISLILHVNSSIATVDSQIDSMTGLINKNNVCLNELEKLYEKSYYLETNLHTSEAYISEASLECLAKEYEYVLSSLSFESMVKSPVLTPRRANLQPLVATLQPPSLRVPGHLQPPAGRDVDLQQLGLQQLDLQQLDLYHLDLQHDRALQSKLSISNLELKPLRCKDARVLKQKSRYRLSAAYTLNPVQEVRNVLSSSRDTYESSVMDHLSDPDTSAYTEEESVEQSLANAHLTKGEKDGRGIGAETTERGNKGTAESENRTDLPPALPETPLHSNVGRAANENSRGSPAGFGALDIRTFDLALLEDYNVTLLASPGSLTSLDNSAGSPPRLDEIDNFHRYLRQSRVDLQAAIQHLPLLRSRSHESIFLDAEHQEELYAPPRIAAPRFHNPTDRIVAAASKGAPALPPTVEAVYLSSFEQPLALGEAAHPDFKTLSRKLLSPLDPPVTPQKNNFGLFSYLSSPTRNAHRAEEGDCGRRGSTEFGKSLALSFRSLVTIKSDVLPVVRAKQSPPEKIKQMRRGIRDPITGRNDSISKRLPPQSLERQLRNGGHSSLTIGPNKTRIINHGQELIFKKPTVRRMSLSLLREALSDSIFL